MTHSRPCPAPADESAEESADESAAPSTNTGAAASSSAGPAGGTAPSLDDLRRSPNALAPHYSRFRVAERLLLTGHSHQAWPDASFEGQQQAWLDAAEHVDDKWTAALAKADRVRRGLAAHLDDRTGTYALGSSTFELVVRFLSALPLRRRPRLVTTDGEFHTLRRQLNRLEEEGLEVVRVPAAPVESVAERLAAAVDDRTAAVLASAVFFGTGRIARGLGEVLRSCRARGAELLVDAYHSTAVAPISLPEEGLDGAFVTGGGYKYLQLGEGNCFLRVPPGRDLRPALTGWYAEFAALAGSHRPGEVAYGGGADAFAGATYDPTSHYRAASVMDFFDARGLDGAFLRRVSQHQVGLLTRLFDDLDLPPSLIDRDRSAPLSEIGGFLALTSPRAGDFRRALAEAGVETDHRDRTLRFGPAPYLSDAQIEEAMGKLGEAARSLA